MKTTQLNHVALHVQDVAATVYQAQYLLEVRLQQLVECNTSEARVLDIRRAGPRPVCRPIAPTSNASSSNLCFWIIVPIAP